MPVLILFKNNFALFFDHFFVAMLLLIFKSTAGEAMFLRSWNIMESSKRPSKHPSINFLSKKRPYSHLRKVQNKNFSVISKYHLSINFLAQKKTISHLKKVQNKNFLVISKYHLSINFLAQKNTIFTISEKFKTRTCH